MEQLPGKREGGKATCRKEGNHNWIQPRSTVGLLVRVQRPLVSAVRVAVDQEGAGRMLGAGMVTGHEAA